MGASAARAANKSHTSFHCLAANCGGLVLKLFASAQANDPCPGASSSASDLPRGPARRLFCITARTRPERARFESAAGPDAGYAPAFF